MSAAPPMSPPGEPELHIAGVLVHLQPAALDALQRTVGTIDGAEVYQHTPDGRAVLVLEAPSAAALLDTLDTIRALPGVLNVSLAYQHAEPLSAMQEEMEP
ncbi:MAG: chaperone NapD [Pseudomonadota bacterium]